MKNTLSINNIQNSVLGFVIVAIVFSMALAFVLIPKQSQAFLGIGDFKFDTIIANIPQLILEILAAAIAAFLTALLQKAVNWVMAKIQNNFIVKNYMKYITILSNKKYIFDYLVNFIPDRDIRNIMIISINAYRSGGLSPNVAVVKNLNTKKWEFIKKKRSQATARTGSGEVDLAESGAIGGKLNPLSDQYYNYAATDSDFLASDFGQYWAIQDASFTAKWTADEQAYASQESSGMKSSFEGNSAIPSEVAYTDFSKTYSPDSLVAGARVAQSQQDICAQDPRQVGCAGNEGSSGNWTDMPTKKQNAAWSWIENQTGGVGGIVKNPVGAVNNMLAGAQDALQKSLGTAGNGLTSTLGNIIGNWAATALTDYFKNKSTTFDESRDFDPLIRTPATLTDLNNTQFGNSSAPMPGIIPAPGFCSTTTMATAGGDLGIVEAGKGSSGGSGTAGSEGSGGGEGDPGSGGGEGTAGVNGITLARSGGALFPGTGSNPCKYFGEQDANNLNSRFNTVVTDGSDGEEPVDTPTPTPTLPPTATPSNIPTGSPPPGCTYTLAPTSADWSSGAQGGGFNIETQGSCNWDAVSSNSSWLSINSGSTFGSGSGTVWYSVTANTGAQRTATITAGGKTFTVTQSGTSGGATPPNISGATYSPTKVTVVWYPVAGATSYKVYRSTSPLGGGTLVGSTGSTQFDDTSVSLGATYYYQVTSVVGGSESLKSGVASVVIPADTTPPAAPSNLTVALSGNTANISWNASTDNVGVTGYVVYIDGLATLYSGGTSASRGSLSSGSHTFYVTANDAAGNESQHSNTVTINVP